MPKEMDFFIFLLEHYSAYKKSDASKVLEEWDELEITDYIYSMYERYHTEYIGNAFEDIDRLILERKG